MTTLPVQTMHQHHYHPTSSTKEEPAAAGTTALLPAFVVKDIASLVAKVGDDRCQKEDGPVASAAAGGRRDAAAAIAESAAVDVCLAAAAMAGAALLAWWAVAYHPAYAQLWMVPIGLVLAGTPPVVCIALRFSTNSNSRVPATTPGKLGSSGTAACTPPPLVAVVVDK